LTAGETKGVDGEAIGIMRRADIAGELVPLDVQWIEAEQCTTPPTSVPRDWSRWVDGIDLDGRGKPQIYHILKEHPGDAVQPYQDFEKIPADLIVHWFRRSRPGQYRGIPECTSALPIGAQRRRWSQATLTAAELAADFAVLVTSNLPAGYSDDDLPAPFAPSSGSSSFRPPSLTRPGVTAKSKATCSLNDLRPSTSTRSSFMVGL
jgi:capsid protein